MDSGDEAGSLDLNLRLLHQPHDPRLLGGDVRSLCWGVRHDDEVAALLVTLSALKRFTSGTNLCDQCAGFCVPLLSWGEQIGHETLDGLPNWLCKSLAGP